MNAETILKEQIAQLTEQNGIEETIVDIMYVLDEKEQFRVWREVVNEYLIDTFESEEDYLIAADSGSDAEDYAREHMYPADLLEALTQAVIWIGLTDKVSEGL